MMKSRYTKLPSVIFLSLLLILHGCTTMRAVEDVHNPDKVREQIKIGEEIVVTTKSGETLHMTIASITNDKITGDGQEVAMEEITQIEVKKTNKMKTAIRTGVILYIIFAILAVKAFLDGIKLTSN